MTNEPAEQLLSDATKPTTAPSSDDSLPPSFEAALTELERIVQTMESGQVPLEEALQSFERGNRLLRHCHGLLAAAEQRLQVLEDGGLAPLVVAAEDEA